MAFTMVEFLQVAGVFGGVMALLALVANSRLIHLCRTTREKDIYQYSKLIIANSLNLIAFSAIHAIAQPIISIEKNVVYVFTASSLVNLPKIGMRLLLAAYGATYCSSLVMCAVMFIYRFNTVCRKTTSNGTVNYFDTNTKMTLWIVGVYCVGLFWGFLIFSLATETPYVDSIITPSLLNYYGKNLSEVTYVAAVYQLNINGTVQYNPSSIFMGCSFVTINSVCMLVIIFCVVEFARRFWTKEPECVVESLQKQLLKVQLIQAIIPVTLIFLPIIGVLLLPLFEINGNVAFSVVSIQISLYPVLDPLALMIVISDFRKRLFCRQKGRYSHTP